jgi:polyisoprenoid-binding protein YceI
MRHRSRAVLLAALPGLLLGVPRGLSAAAWRLDVEPNHTTIGFQVPIAGGLTRVSGKFTAFTVEIVYDEADLGRCSVVARIKADSIDTGIIARDEHLRQEVFFDAERHPEIVFQSRRVERRGKQHVAVGELTLRGVTRPLDVPFEVTGTPRTGEAPRLGIAARLTVDREAFGVGTGWKHDAIPDFLGREVAVEIFLWTRLGRPEGQKPSERASPNPSPAGPPSGTRTSRRRDARPSPPRATVRPTTWPSAAPAMTSLRWWAPLAILDTPMSPAAA